jgi:hypothetical protein
MAGKKKRVAPGTVFTIPLGNGAVAQALVLFVLDDYQFLMGILERESVRDMATLTEVCNAVGLLLYSGQAMLHAGDWPTIGCVELPDTTPLTERIVAGRVRVGDKVVKVVADKTEREKYVSGGNAGQRLVEDVVRDYRARVQNPSRFLRQAKDASAALLERCRNVSHP